MVVKSSLAFYNRLFLVPKPNGQWRPILDLSKLNLFLSTNTFMMETPETIRLSLQQGEWVTSLDFSDAYFHIPIAQRSRNYLRFHLNKISYHFPSLWSGNGPVGIHQSGQGGQANGSSKGYQDPPVPRRLVATSPFPGSLPTAYPDLCQGLGWLVNMQKSELVPQQVFNFVGYRFDLLTGRVLCTQDRLTSLKETLLFIKARNSCTVRQFMSLIGLLTATEKQVWSGRLHKRPIQWHLKRHWHVPEVLEKVIPVPMSLHPHLDWWLDDSNVHRGQPLHPLQHAFQVFTDASNEGWGAYLGKATARGVWSKPEGKLHINFLELKAVFLALKSIKPNCSDCDRQHDCGLVHKQGGRYEIRLSLCPPVETSVLVPSQGNSPEGKAHSGSLECDSGQAIQTQSGRLNVIADKLSRHNQVIQTEWSLDQRVFNLLCSKWGLPQVDLFATRFNFKIPRFVSPVPDQRAWAVDALSQPWEGLEVYAFPPVSLLNLVVSKVVDQGCRRMILIARGWPNMPWFWDLVNLSVQVPF